MSENLRGAALMAGASACFAVNDGLMKAILADVPFLEAFFLRSLGSMVVIWVIARWQGALNFRLSRRDGGLVVLRSLAEVLSATLFLLALSQMPLPNVNAILQTAPLAMTLAGAFVLGETIGWRRTLAIMAGLVGVLLVVRPGGENFGWPALLALACVCMVVVRDVTARFFSPSVTAMTAALSMATLLTLCTGVAAIFADWAPIGAMDLLRLVASILAVAAGYVLLVNATRLGELSFIAPFRYTSLLWALLIGYFAFGFWPDQLSLLGAFIIVLAGLYAFYREMTLARGGDPQVGVTTKT